MALLNGYITLADFKLMRGGTFAADSSDDTAIEGFIDSASRFHETETGRAFYPRVETQQFDQTSARGIRVHDDLLAVISVTNGDGTSIAGTEYNLYPLNTYPKCEIRIKETSIYYWSLDSDSNTEGVIDLAAYWGYHNDYARRGWKSVGTLGAAMSDTTTASLTMTAGHSVAAGHIIKIDNELMIVTAVATNAVTLNARGDNGSTAATHSNGATVYAWQFMTDIRQSVFELVTAMYGRRTGDNAAGESIITSGGAVITTRNIPAYTASVIRRYRRYV